MKIYLVGYRPSLLKKKHTNFWPWDYLKNTFIELGYDAEHRNINSISNKKPGLYICWNEPDCIELIENHKPHPDSIIVQKLTSFDGSQRSQTTSWGENPRQFFKDWNWPQYKKLDYLAKSGYRFYAFGAKSDTEYAPVKKKYAEQYKEHIFWIPWGSMIVPYHDIVNASPIVSGFSYDVGFVGSKWGTKIRGNIGDWEMQLDPVVNEADSSFIAGRGTSKGPISNRKHIEVLKKSRICPIIHASGWKAERGIMDRFWTVFSLGRFGVVDNLGVLDFYDEKDLVLELDPNEYVEKSIYYMKNVEKQLPYIQKVQDRIKKEYNQHEVWKKILKKMTAS